MIYTNSVGPRRETKQKGRERAPWLETRYRWFTRIEIRLEIAERLPRNRRPLVNPPKIFHFEFLFARWKKNPSSLSSSPSSSSFPAYLSLFDFHRVYDACSRTRETRVCPVIYWRRTISHENFRVNRPPIRYARVTRPESSLLIRVSTWIARYPRRWRTRFHAD